MKSIIYLLLLCVQANCYHLSGHPNNQDGHREDSLLEHQHSFLGIEEKNPTDYDKIASVNTDFAFRFYNHVISTTANKNVFFSPLSVTTALAMLALGAKSETRSQLLKGLGFNLSKIKEDEIHEGFHHLLHNRPYARSPVTMWTEPEVNIENTLFIEESLKPLPGFSKNIRALYEAETFPCNFSNYMEAEKQINDYIKNKTNGKIPHSVQRLDQATAMVLVNYITFKGVLKDLHLFIPKFTISSSYNLKDIMEKLGVTDIFNNDADLSGINGERSLKVSKMVHKAVLDLRESGTEEQTVTTLWSSPLLLPISSTPVIKFNKPYMMVIMDKKINIIFLTKMVDPTEGQT